MNGEKGRKGFLNERNSTKTVKIKNPRQKICQGRPKTWYHLSSVSCIRYHVSENAGHTITSYITPSFSAMTGVPDRIYSPKTDFFPWLRGDNLIIAFQNCAVILAWGKRNDNQNSHTTSVQDPLLGYQPMAERPGASFVRVP